MSYQDTLGKSYPSVERQSVYSTAQAKKVIHIWIENRFDVRKKIIDTQAAQNRYKTIFKYLKFTKIICSEHYLKALWYTVIDKQEWAYSSKNNKQNS